MIWIEVIGLGEDDKELGVVHAIDVQGSMPRAEKVERGLLHQMNRDKFCTRIIEVRDDARWFVGKVVQRSATEGRLVMAKDTSGELRTMATAASPDLAKAIAKARNSNGPAEKRSYLGTPCWMTAAPKCPEHRIRLDLEWYKDDEVMWYCKTCTREAKAAKTEEDQK